MLCYKKTNLYPKIKYKGKNTEKKGGLYEKIC